MARCEICGNDYDKAFQVSMDGTTHTFDSFECAIHALVSRFRSSQTLAAHSRANFGIKGTLANL
jgi:hypothetical protein